MAKKFSFRFAALERMRELIEKDRTRELGIAMQRMQQLTAEYQSLGEERFACMEAIKGKQVGSLDMNSLLNARAWIADLSSDGAKKLQEITTQQEVVNQRRQSLLEATKDCKVMEKLNERDREQWLKEIESDEQKALDDTPRSPLLQNERGNAGQMLVTILAMASLAALFVTIALFVFGYLSTEKVSQIQWVLTDQGAFLNKEQVLVYQSSEDNKKKFEDLFNKQKLATDGLAVNKSFEAQEKLLTKKRQALLEVEKRLRVLRAEVENEKNNIVTMQEQVETKINAFNDRRKKADDFAKSEGMQKAIKIFNNMEPTDISDTLTKGKEPQGDALTETTAYLKLMREDLAAEVLGAMSITWKQAINKELNKVAIKEDTTGAQ